jgi:hypothetical protein
MEKASLVQQERLFFAGLAQLVYSLQMKSSGLASEPRLKELTSGQ